MSSFVGMKEQVVSTIDDNLNWGVFVFRSCTTRQCDVKRVENPVESLLGRRGQEGIHEIVLEESVEVIGMGRKATANTNKLSEGQLR